MKVRIVITYNMMQYGGGAVRRAAECAFGVSLTQKECPVNIICTAEQLVGFQVARDKLGGQNLWKEMKVEILNPTFCGRTIDVTGYTASRPAPAPECHPCFKIGDHVTQRNDGYYRVYYVQKLYRWAGGDYAQLATLGSRSPEFTARVDTLRRA